MIEAELYRQELLDRIANPTNRGIIDSPDIEASRENPLCADQVTIQLKIEKNIITSAKHSGTGCAISQASADLLSQNIEGKNLYQVGKLATGDILTLLGVTPGPSRLKCALLGIEALKEEITNGSQSKS